MAILLLASLSTGCTGSAEPGASAQTAAPAPSAPVRPAVAAPEAPSSPEVERPASAPRQEPLAAAQRPAPEPEKPVAEPASAPKVPQIPLGELLTQRDLWPAKVALTRPLTIEPGVTLPVGHELPVYEFNGSEIVLDVGNDDGADLRDCPADQTDVIARASALKASLTPEQLALTDNTLHERPELWPLEVTVRRRMQFQNGKEIPVGRVATVRSVTIGWVNLYDDVLADHFQAEAFETDVIARARERLDLPQAERQPFFVRSVAAALEPSSAASDPGLAQSDYVLVYRARMGCPRCEAFAPELAKFYERVKPLHPRFETVFYSEDKTAEDARAVFAKEKLPGRAIRFERRFAAADLASQTGQLLPLVYLYDRSGALIARNQPSGGSPSAADVLAMLETKLAEPVRD